MAPLASAERPTQSPRYLTHTRHVLAETSSKPRSTAITDGSWFMGIVCQRARAHCGRVLWRTHSLFEFKYSILKFILACAFHTCTSRRPSGIPTGPTRAMLKRLGTRSAHIWFARCASAPRFTAAGQIECECPNSDPCTGSHSTSPCYLRLAALPAAWDA